MRKIPRAAGRGKMGKKRKKNGTRQGDPEEMGKKRRREEEKEEIETVRCVGSVSVDAFDIFSQGRDLESCGAEGLSDCEPEARVDVSVVLVSPSSVVTEFCDGCSFCSDCGFVEPQSFSFSKKRAHSWTVTQEKDEVGKLTNESASASSIWKKNDADHTTAKFVFIV